MDTNCDKCRSDNIEFVRYKFSNNTEHLRKQCNDCGRVLPTGYKRDTVPDFWSLPLVDEDKRQALFESIKRISEAKRVVNYFRMLRIEKDKKYYREVYLLSNEWKEKRNAVMEAYQWKCQKCSEPATELHHNNYDNIFKEKFEDLTPLCRNCHSNEHPEHQNKIITNDEPWF